MVGAFMMTQVVREGDNVGLGDQPLHGRQR